MSEESAEPGPGALAALQALGGATTERARKLLSAYWFGTLLWRHSKAAWVQTRSAVTFTVAVPGDDAIYPDIHRWLLEQLPSARRRALTVQTKRESTSPVPVDDSTSAGRPDLRFFYDGSREQTVTIEGFRVRVQVEKEADRIQLRGREFEYERERERIIFTCYGAKARDAVLRFVERVTEAHHASRTTPDFWIAGSWGHWRHRGDLPIRPLDTIVLRAGQKEELVEDLDRFLTSEPIYVALGIPYHRGYLLHGPPGTGKTSVARALASAFKLDVYYIPLRDLREDASLLDLVSEVRPRSVLLLEDVDVYHAAKSRDDSGKGISLSGLLNALDGIATPHGLITVMTTNDLSVLDEAVVRPGRVDRRVHIGVMDDDQLRRLVQGLVGHPVDLPAIGDREVTPAEVVEVLKRHVEDLEAGVVAVKEMLA